MNVEAYKKRLLAISLGLQKMITIPQVKEKLPLLQEITAEGFFDGISALDLERIRRNMRDIVKFLVNQGPNHKIIYTALADPITETLYDVTLSPDEDFADYKLKVNRYLKDYGNNLVINKLRMNKPLTKKNTTSSKEYSPRNLVRLMITHKLSETRHSDYSYEK